MSKRKKQGQTGAAVLAARVRKSQDIDVSKLPEGLGETILKIADDADRYVRESTAQSETMRSLYEGIGSSIATTKEMVGKAIAQVDTEKGNIDMTLEVGVPYTTKGINGQYFKTFGPLGNAYRMLRRQPSLAPFGDVERTRRSRTTIKQVLDDAITNYRSVGQAATAQNTIIEAELGRSGEITSTLIDLERRCIDEMEGLKGPRAETQKVYEESQKLYDAAMTENDGSLEAKKRINSLRSDLSAKRLAWQTVESKYTALETASQHTQSYYDAVDVCYEALHQIHSAGQTIATTVEHETSFCDTLKGRLGLTASAAQLAQMAIRAREETGAQLSAALALIAVNTSLVQKLVSTNFKRGLFDPNAIQLARRTLEAGSTYDQLPPGKEISNYDPQPTATPNNP